MTYRNCNFCQGNQTDTIDTESGFDIVKCNKCGFLYVNPYPEQKDLENYYNNYFSSDVKLHPKYGISKENYYRKGLRKIKLFNYSGGNLLDLGCGMGEFLNIAKKSGFKVFGVDISKNAVSHCREILGLAIETGTLKSIGYKESFFDVVTMWDFLEHIPDPMDELKEVNRILRKDGILFIRAPNMNFYLLLKWIFGLIGKESPYGYHPEHHLNFFTPKTLTLFLNKTGYKVLSIEVGDSPKSLDHPFLRDVYVSFAKIINSLLSYNIGPLISIYALKIL